VAETSGVSPQRIYDKGERRHKHAGQTATAEVVFDRENPRRATGRCPNTITQARREELLRDAIPGPIGDRSLEVPKRLYVVHEGVIYEAQTSDAGMSYHAYPYHGPLNGKLIRALWLTTTGTGYERAFEAWVKAHIEARGRWR
jgi:hypothetical protein